MARRSEHSQEEIKQMVLNAAETIVIKEGFAELKVRKVAMDIGYTVGSIYMVFDNMSDLIMQVKGKTLDDMTKQLSRVVEERDAGAETNIELLAKAYLAFAGQNYNRWAMIFEHNLANDDAVPDWYQEKIDAVFGIVESQFMHLPSPHSEAQNQLAARALWSGVHGICTLSLTGKVDLLGSNNIENTVELLVENFISGWKKSH